MTAHSPASSSGGAHRWKAALGTLLTGTFFFCVIAVINAWFIEPSDPGSLAKRMAYDWQQLRLAVMRRAPAELVVVDIGSLPACPEDGPHGTIFPRTALKEAITAVLAHRPAAIGIDFDFAPGPNVSCTHAEVASPYSDHAGSEKRWDWTARGGPALFDFVLQHQQTPIYLGVFRTQGFPPEQWLGGEAYTQLAAGVVMPPEPEDPNAEECLPEHAATESVPGQRRYIARAIVSKHGRLPSMSEMLYRRRQEREQSLRSRIGGLLPQWVREDLLEVTKEETICDVKLEEFLVDFSAHKTLRDTTVTFVDHALKLPPGVDLKGKLVLLGHTDVKGARDKFPLPGTNRLEAGVYWHASGADTLIRGVLVQPTKCGRHALDFVFYFPGLALIVWRQLRSPQVDVHRLQSRITKWSAAGVLVVGLVFVHFIRLMWDDFIVIAVLLAAHPTLERWTIGIYDWIRDRMTTVWNRATEQE